MNLSKFVAACATHNWRFVLERNPQTIHRGEGTVQADTWVYTVVLSSLDWQQETMSVAKTLEAALANAVRNMESLDA